MYNWIVLGVVASIVIAISTAITIMVLRDRKRKKIMYEREMEQDRIRITWRPMRRSEVGNLPTNPQSLADGIVQVTQTAVQIPLSDSLGDDGTGEEKNLLNPENSIKTKSVGIFSNIVRKITRPSGPTQFRKSSRTSKISAHSITCPEMFNSVQEAVSSLDAPSTRKTSNGSGCDINGNLEPEIILSILYSEVAASLTITVLCVTNLDCKIDDHHNVYVQAVLRPKHNQKQCTQDVPVQNAEFNECFFFDKLMALDFPNSHLMLTVNKSSTHKQVAELFISMASINLEPEVASHFKFPMITKPRSRRKSTSEKLLQADLGQILILLHYQAIPNRLKVQVNKANQLPKAESTPFKTDYQVVIELFCRRNHRKLTSKCSLIQSGESPKWNESFLFDLGPDQQLDEHYLDFTVLEKSRRKPSDDVIGHVLLGPDNTSSQAVNQWSECSQPCKLEEAQWHSILPVIKYNIETME